MDKHLTLLLQDASEGDRVAADQVFLLVYEQLKSIATARMRNESPDHTLQPTALVHEVWFKIFGSKKGGWSWNDRSHFFAAAAQSMRRILVDSARARNSVRRGGGQRGLELDDRDLGLNSDTNLLALDDALSSLATLDPIKAKLVELRFFAGCTMAEIAEQLSISLTTADRYWAYARAWLKKEIQN